MLVRRKFIPALITVFAAVSAAASAMGQSGQPSFSLAISTSSDVVKAGSEVRVKISLVNRSDHDIGLNVERTCPCGEAHANIEVQDEKGVRAPLTRRGHIMRGEAVDSVAEGPTGTQTGNAAQPAPGRVEDDLVVGSDFFYTLQPGKALNDVILANKLYDLSKPGKYSIQVSRFDPESKTTVTSNTITVTVVPATP